MNTDETVKRRRRRRRLYWLWWGGIIPPQLYSSIVHRLLYEQIVTVCGGDGGGRGLNDEWYTSDPARGPATRLTRRDRSPRRLCTRACRAPPSTCSGAKSSDWRRIAGIDVARCSPSRRTYPRRRVFYTAFTRATLTIKSRRRRRRRRLSRSVRVTSLRSRTPSTCDRVRVNHVCSGAVKRRHHFKSRANDRVTRGSRERMNE